MKRESVRTSIDLPRDLHRRLHEAGASTWTCPSTFDLTNEQIYGLIDFP